MRKYSKETFSIAGAEFNIRKSLIALAVACGCLAVFLILKFAGVGVSWYGALIGLAFLLALAFAVKYTKYRDLNEDLPYDLIWWVFPSSLIGARLYYCIFDNAWNIFFDFTKGGLAVYGGIIGGAIGLIVCCLIKKVNILKAMDIVAPVLLMGQAVGRIGCYTAGCCYGLSVTNKSMQWFPIAYYVNGGWHLATFFWESCLCVGGFFLLAYLLRKYKNTGLITSGYLFYYGLVRYFTENFRDPSAQLNTTGGAAVSQWLSLILVILGTIGICITILRDRKKRAEAIIEEDNNSDNR